MIGVLYEDAWTLNETCRFRVFGSANAYDSYNGEKLHQQKEKRVSFNLAGNRKRNAPSAQAENEQQSSTAQPSSGTGSNPVNNNSGSDFAGKESAWNLKDCIFIHEEAVNDTSIVKIVDGAYCGIVFKSTVEKLESEPSLDLNKMGIRLMRKDDLVLVSVSSRGSRSPENFQAQFKQIRLPSSVKRVLSVAVDLTGFRVLCEKRSRVHLLRISCVGKLLSDHPIPVNFGALTQNKKDDSYECIASVENFGDEAILLLRDNIGGGFQPLLRNISGGYKQLSYTGLGRILQYGMGMRYFASTGEIRSASICSEQISVDKKIRNSLSNKNAYRILLMVALVSPSPENTLPDGSLMQAILFCQLDVVIAILKNLQDVSIERQPAIVCEQLEGNRNIFHVAVQNAYSRTNADQADLDATDSRLSVGPQKADTGEAEAVKTRYERKWQEMISSAPTTRAKAQQQQQLLNELTSETPKKDSSPESIKDEPESADSSDVINKKIPIAAKERQANSIEIIRELCKNSVIREYFIDLMRQRDINGHSPFETAIYQRAYSAAQLMWQTAIDVKEWSQDVVDILMPSVGSDDSNEDSSLFILCANDTCSYTWTGEEHTPQKIYECKTCGLVGTLCCCTECALLCHRNHDCKLKRTSPTAYCDCWEKCDCKALVTGNTANREQLLSGMLQCSTLIDGLNSKGEHILLFLARTVGRQLIEQEGYTKRSKRPGPASTTTANGTSIPEHDLEPPKFARKALDLAIGNWDVVKSLLDVGIKKQKSTMINSKTEDDEPVLESVFHLLEHDGSTHLDKFVLTLLGWCDESNLDTLLNLLVRQANKQQKKWDEEVHILIQRFVRSVIRLFVMVILLSPNANGTLLATIFDDINKAIPATDAPTLIYPLTQSNAAQPGTSTSAVAAIRDSLHNYRAAAISGVLSLVRASLPAALSLNSSIEKKDQKKHKIIAFVAKCRRVFQALISYSLLELIGIADALISPIRLGIVKPSVSIVSNEDVLEVLQQHLTNEQDLSSLIRMSMLSGDRNETVTGEANNARIIQLADLRRGDTSQATDLAMERASDDDMSNDDDDDEEDLDAPALISRTRENSNTSFNARERTISEQSRRRQETATGLEESLDEHEGEDPYGSDHDDIDDDDDDDEVEPYFDIHDDDDDDDDGEGHGGSDVNPLDGEGDSNDTATVTIGDQGTTSSMTAETANSVEGSNTSATISIEPAARQAGSQTQIAVSASESSARVGATTTTTTNPTSNVGGDGSRRGGMGWGDGIIMDENSWGRNNNNMFGSGTSNSQRPNDPRSTVLRSTTANSTTASISVNDSVTLGGSGATSLPLAAQSAVTADNNVVANLGDNGDFATSNTSTQLSACFSTIVKLIDELLLQLFFYENWKQQSNKTKGITLLLDLDPKIFGVLKNAFDGSLDPTWNWFFSIMDKTEAQLRYSNALMNSSVGRLLNLNQNDLSDSPDDRREEQQRSLTAPQRNRTAEQKKPLTKRVTMGAKRGGDGNVALGDSDGQNDARAENISYFLSLLRSYSAENGDDLPVLELNALRDLTFITEAYLFHICFIDQLDQAKAVVPVKSSRTTRGNSEIRQQESEEQKMNKLHRFFKRSNSISYSTLSDADKHHSFTYTAADVLPLSVRPHLLNSEAERDVLFALPPPYRTRSMHRRIALEHGVKFPAHQSLSQPPMSYAELQSRLCSDEASKDQQEQKSAATHNDSDAMEVCTTTDDVDVKQLSPPICNSFQRSIGRWNRTISFIAKTFHDDITKWFGGDSSHSVLIHKTGVCSFNVRYSQFRKQMDRLKSTQTKDLVFNQVPREKYVLLQQTFRQLNHHYVRRMSGASGTSSSTATPSQISNARTGSVGGLGRASLPLASHKVKVTFRDEPGEGTGVARHFYAAVAEALTTVKHLPSLDNVNEDGTNKSEASKTAGKSASVGPTTPNTPKAEDTGANGGGRTLRSSTAGATSTPASTEAALMPAPSTPALSASSFILPTGSDNQTPLFYKATAKSSGGFYTPITGQSCSSQRLNAFRNVGRLIGICLQHMEIFPLPLSRYVLKYILGRNITWYDLAFFDPSLFDSLRSIVYNEADENYQSQDFFNQLEMTFAVDLPAEEGGGTLELKPGGADIPVNNENVLEYIYLFVENRLIGRNKASLDAIRRGVFDVLPTDALINLTAEDMRLILCGSQDINLQILQSFTKFFDESSAPANVLAKYKKNFWIVVNKFSNAEKQDLCFFWTGSPNLPSTEEGFQPLPTIMIRPADDVHLPTANTCISRLYVPLYSSKKILASKLLLAIKAHNFGFV
ncbi:hypothetical protein ACQ4LE_000066 [Meloidogyne hapla]